MCEKVHLTPDLHGDVKFKQNKGDYKVGEGDTCRDPGQKVIKGEPLFAISYEAEAKTTSRNACSHRENATKDKS